MKLSEKTVHTIFNITILFKGLYVLVEMAGGIVLFFITQQSIINVVLRLTHGELVEDPKDLIANYLVRSAESFSISSQHFVALYLVTYGLIKGLLIIGLFKKKLWLYPWAIAVFSIFGLYQIVEFIRTDSLGLLALTVLDIVIIGLTWHEYRYMQSSKENSLGAHI